MGQTIVLNGDITIVINRIDNKTVRIGIDAPKDVNIVRGELLVPHKTAEEGKAGK